METDLRVHWLGGGKPGAEPSWDWEPEQAKLGGATENRGEEERGSQGRIRESKEQTRGRKGLGEENLGQRFPLFYFLRYDPEEGQTLTFYSGGP